MGHRVVLVTGGAGFLGSHLCDRLIGEGAEVICVDSLVTGTLDNIAHLMGRKGFRFFRHDVTEPFDPGARVTEIFNLACPASPVKYGIDPIHTFRTNVMGVMHLLDLARAHGARMVQASTSEVYGDPAISPQVETYWGHVNPVGPRACYDEGKRGAETLCYHHHEQHGTDVRIARIFNTYGPRMARDDGRVVSNFIVQALTGAPLTIYGTGEQTRSFCYVDDLIEGLCRLMAAQPPAPGPVNLGNPGEFTMLQLAELVLERTRSTSPLVFAPLPQDDPRQRRPDIALAGRLLGWAPRVPLGDGLDHTISHFSELIHQGQAGE